MKFAARTVEGLKRLTARTVEAMEGAVIVVGWCRVDKIRGGSRRSSPANTARAVTSN